MKKMFAALVLVLLLASCGPATTSQVSFMIFGDPAELAAYQKLVAAFEAQYPQTHIQLRHVASQSDYQQQLLTAFSAGAPPDVMLLNYRRVVQFAGSGGLEPLGHYVEQSPAIRLADFYAPAIEAFQWNDQLWCVPQNISSLVVYYNRKLFDAAGQPYPTNTWTQDDFLQAARALTKDADGDGQTDQYGAGLAPSLLRLAPFIWQNDGELVDAPTQPTHLALGSSAALEAFQWFVDLQVKEKVVPDAVAEEADASENRFLNGRLAMYLNSRRGTTTYRTITTFEWDVAPLPMGHQPANVLHSDGYCMAAKTQNKPAAWTFIEFANSIAGQTLMASTGRTVPSLIQVAESDAFLDPRHPPANSRIFIDTIPTIRRVPLMTTWVAIEETTSKEIERAFYGRALAEEAAATALSLTQPYFDRAANNR